MSGDPLAGDVGDPQSLNLYAYVRNNPINFIDPTGLDCVPAGRSPNGTPILSCTGGGGGGGHNLMPPGGSYIGPIDSEDCNGGCKPAWKDQKKPKPREPKQGIAQSACVQPNLVQRAGIKVQAWLAEKFNVNVGFGVGVSGALGRMVGYAYGASAQMVVTPNGHASLVYTYSTNSLGTIPGPVAGAGVIGGLQVSVGTPSAPANGQALALSGGYARGYGASVDVSYSDSGGLQGTVTGPFGYGGWGAAPQLQFTNTISVCR